jgi:hypothetical protein
MLVLHCLLVVSGWEPNTTIELPYASNDFFSL